MWSPIPRIPTSCALSTSWLPELSRPIAPVPENGGRRFLCPAPPRSRRRILSCGGQTPAAILNGGTLSCTAAIVRIAAAAAAAPVTETTAGPSPCPPFPACPGFPAATAPPTPAGRCTSLSPPSSGRTRRTAPTPAAAAAAAAAECRAAPPGAATYPHSFPPRRAAGGFFCVGIPCLSKRCASRSFFRQKKLLTNGRRLIKYP